VKQRAERIISEAGNDAQKELEESNGTINEVRRQAREVIGEVKQRASTELERQGIEAVHRLSGSDEDNG
jgi:hypothetical protein